MGNAPDTPDNALPTSDEFCACAWRAAIAKCSEKECRRYSVAFFLAADAAKAAGNTSEYRALRLLGDLTSMALRFDQPAAPLSDDSGARASVCGGRFAGNRYRCRQAVRRAMRMVEATWLADRRDDAVALAQTRCMGG